MISEPDTNEPVEWSQERIDEINKEADTEAIIWIRDAAKKFGFNCTFADDDFMIICSLANRAIEADLTDHLHKSIIERLKLHVGQKGGE